MTQIAQHYSRILSGFTTWTILFCALVSASYAQTQPSAPKINLAPRPTLLGGGATGPGGTAGTPGGLAGPGSCLVNSLVLEFRTGNDDLRGGDNNLNVEVHYADGSMQLIPNVNKVANWPNYSDKTVQVQLTRPVPPNSIKQLKLVHLAQGNFKPNANVASPETGLLQGIHTEDNWSMAGFQANAFGNGVNIPIASAGFYRFTGSSPDLAVPTRPGITCPSPNQVRELQFYFTTGNDDLRADNNLNITIHFADGGTQSAANVNQGQGWPNGAQRDVKVTLNRAATVEQIKSVTLETSSKGGVSGDNWNMESVQIIAVVNGANQTIANYGFHRFSSKWSGPEANTVTIATK